MTHYLCNREKLDALDFFVYFVYFYFVNTIRLVKKFSFFKSDILIFFSKKEKKKFLLHSYLNQSQINGVAWMRLNFYDYHGFQKNQGVYRIMKHNVPTELARFYDEN